MGKIILEVKYLKCFKRITYFIPRGSQDLYFSLRYKKKTGLLIFNSFKQKKLILIFFVNRNWNKLTDSCKRAKILADNRKSPPHWNPHKYIKKEIKWEACQDYWSERDPPSPKPTSTLETGHWVFRINIGFDSRLALGLSCQEK